MSCRTGPLFSFLLLSISFIACTPVMAQDKKKPAANAELLQLIDNNLQQADKQYKFLVPHVPADSFAKDYIPKTGKVGFCSLDGWVSGFYPGTLLYLYEATHDVALKNAAVKKLAELKNEQYDKTTHDLGFMMYCSYGNANRIMPSEQYKNVLINSARSLACRFDPKVGCIRSWNSDSSHFLVIIDNMMNLELLCWAAKATGDQSFKKIAVTHANTTMKNHFRPDYSSYHLVDYNPKTGVPQERKTVQGFAKESAWARGQAWGLYGFTVMYRETRDKKYLEQADHIAEFILNNPNLPADKIPYWDYNAGNIPNAERDASAAAVMCSALIELSQYNKGEVGRKYLSTAEIILRSLSSPAYKSPIGEDGGFLLMHSTGHHPAGIEIDASIIYADYYFVEANMRYRKLIKK